MAVTELVPTGRESLRSTRTTLVTAVVLAVAFVVIGVVSNLAAFTSSLTEDGDAAADAIRAEQGWRETTGIFSRWGFHHPGPVIFWMKWLGLRLADLLPGIGPLGGQMLMQLAVVSAAIGLTGWVLAESTGRPIAIWASFAIAALTVQGSHVVAWAPYIATWAVLLGVAAVAAIPLGRWWGLPLAIWAGLAAVHLHVVFAPAGALIVCAGVAVRLARRSMWGRRERVAVRGAIVAMGWPLLLTDWSQYTQTPEGAGSVRSWSVGLRYAANTLSPMDIQPKYPTAISQMVGLVVVGLMLIAALRVLDRRCLDPATVVAGGGIMWAIYIVAICRLDFIGTLAIAGPILPIMLVVPAATLLTPTHAERAAVAAAGGLVILGAFTGPRVGVPNGTAEQAMRGYAGGTLIVDHSPDRWNSYVPAASLVLLAERQHIDVCVAEDRWPHWVPNRLLCTPDESGTLITFDTAISWTTD